jgi:hypothetical protein
MNRIGIIILAIVVIAFALYARSHAHPWIREEPE